MRQKNDTQGPGLPKLPALLSLVEMYELSYDTFSVTI